VYIEDTVMCGVYVPGIYMEDVPFVEFMYLVYRGCTSVGVYIPCILRMYLLRSLCMLYLLACQMRFTVADSGLCCGNYV